jgi:hypothetical protein
MKHKSGRNKVAENNKRISALSRLENQLKSGVKVTKDRDENGYLTIALNDLDVKRINKEISVLKSRVVSNEVAMATRTKKNRSGMRK